MGPQFAVPISNPQLHENPPSNSEPSEESADETEMINEKTRKLQDKNEGIKTKITELQNKNKQLNEKIKELQDKNNRNKSTILELEMQIRSMKLNSYNRNISATDLDDSINDLEAVRQKNAAENDTRFTEYNNKISEYKKLTFQNAFRVYSRDTQIFTLKNWIQEFKHTATLDNLKKLANLDRFIAEFENFYEMETILQSERFKAQTNNNREIFEANWKLNRHKVYIKSLIKFSEIYKLTIPEKYLIPSLNLEFIPTEAVEMDTKNLENVQKQISQFEEQIELLEDFPKGKFRRRMVLGGKREAQKI